MQFTVFHFANVQQIVDRVVDVACLAADAADQLDLLGRQRAALQLIDGSGKSRHGSLHVVNDDVGDVLTSALGLLQSRAGRAQLERSSRNQTIGVLHDEGECDKE